MFTVMISPSLNVRALGPVPSEVVALLRRIDRFQGRLDAWAEPRPARAEQLAVRSRIESVIASNELEGVRTTRDRAEKLVLGALEPTTRDEHELAGYRAALDDVYGRPYEPVTVPRLLHWHRELLGHAGPDVAGRLKVHENRVTNPDGSDRFLTVPVAHTPAALEAATDDAETALRDGVHHPVLITAAFVLDLLVIHPFEDGNGRVARIATNSMLLRSDYGVGRFISLEQLVAERRTAYYETLRRSTDGWHEGLHSLWPWATFLAEVVAQSYEGLGRRLEVASPEGDRALVLHWLQQVAPRTFSMREATGALAGVPPGTVRRVLQQERQSGALVLRGAGRAAHWVIRDRAQLGSAADSS